MRPPCRVRLAAGRPALPSRAPRSKKADPMRGRVCRVHPLAHRGQGIQDSVRRRPRFRLQVAKHLAERSGADTLPQLVCVAASLTVPHLRCADGVCCCGCVCAEVITKLRMQDAQAKQAGESVGKGPAPAVYSPAAAEGSSGNAAAALAAVAHVEQSFSLERRQQSQPREGQPQRADADPSASNVGGSQQEASSPRPLPSAMAAEDDGQRDTCTHTALAARCCMRSLIPSTPFALCVVQTHTRRTTYSRHRPSFRRVRVQPRSRGHCRLRPPPRRDRPPPQCRRTRAATEGEAGAGGQVTEGEVERADGCIRQGWGRCGC